MAEQKQRVLVVSLELTTGQLAVNAVVRYSGIPLRHLEQAQAKERQLSEEQHAALAAASDKLARTEMYLRLHGAEEHGRSIEDVIRSATRSRFDAVFVDHIGMVGRDQGDELGQLNRCIDRLRALKSGQITKGYTPFVFAISPLSREARKDEDDHLPSLGDFRGSSRIDYDSDLAMILRRQKRDAEDESDVPDKVDGFVVKNRFGRCPMLLQFEARGSAYLVVERRKDEPPPPAHWSDA